MVQKGWQMEISPTWTGRGVFVDILVHVKQKTKGNHFIQTADFRTLSIFFYQDNRTDSEH